MKKYTPNQYVDIFDKLPLEIKDLIVSTATTDHITLIGKKHNLHIDKIGNLVDITFDVMMGIVATKDFVKEIQDTLEIGALEASVLARDVDENIFKPIKETMTHLYAGRAPYKPSSSLVQYYEEDEEHPSLDKATLLKEIEDPVEAVVKREIVTTKVPSFQVSGVSLNANKEIQKENHNTPQSSYRSSTPFGSTTSSKGLALGSLSPSSPLILSGEEMRNFPSHLEKGEVRIPGAPQDSLRDFVPKISNEWTVPVREAGRGLSFESKPNNLTSSPANQLVEYHQELKNEEKKEGEGFQVSGSGLEVKKEIEKPEIISPPAPSYLKRGEDASNLTTSPTNNLNASSILSQLASIKLNQAFVMPKGAEGVAQLRGLQDESAKLSSTEANTKLSGVGFQVKEEGAKDLLTTKEKVVNLGENSKEKIITPPTPSYLKRGENADNLTPSSTNTPVPKIDPYRERI